MSNTVHREPQNRVQRLTEECIVNYITFFWRPQVVKTASGHNVVVLWHHFRHLETSGQKVTVNALKEVCHCQAYNWNQGSSRITHEKDIRNINCRKGGNEWRPFLTVLHEGMYIIRCCHILHTAQFCHIAHTAQETPSSCSEHWICHVKCQNSVEFMSLKHF